MTVHVPGERLLAVVDDLHRPVRVQREHRAVHLHREVLAAAERAADPAEVDAHLLQRQSEARRDLGPVDMQPLRRDVDVDAALAVGYREPRLGPEERLILAADLVHATDGDVALRVDVSVANLDVAHDVRARVVEVAMAPRRSLGMQIFELGRALHVGDRLERLVLDDDAFGSAARLLRVLGGDEGDRLAVVEDTVDRQHGLVLELEPVRLLPGHVVVCEHRVHPRHRNRLRDVERDDARVRVRAAQRVAPEHPRDDQVARVGKLALHLRRRVDPRNELADPSLLHPASGLGHAFAARRTASKIFA